MLNEPSSLATGKNTFVPQPVAPTVQQQNPVIQQLEAAVAEVMDIHQTEYQSSTNATMSFTGVLRLDSETAYDQLDQQFEPLDHHALLTTNDAGQHVVIALRGRVRPEPRPWWPNAVLLVATLLSLLLVGAGSFELWRGIPYAVSLILILGAHELGHYFAARHHKVNVTLPYFIPFPLSFFGTLGAFIQLREPMRNRKVLFDVGVAGPLAGMVVAVPILIIGLATSDIEPLPNEAYYLEGNSLFYAGSKLAIFGELLPNENEDVFINQMAKAGWTGLFITGLNLIPVGQLDGGHVAYTLLGRRAQRLYWPVMAGFVTLSLFNSAWIFWTILLLLLGRGYTMPLDNVTVLDSRRRRLGYLALVIFVLVFVPNPLQIIDPT
ncbi:MAG: site-2 protease family protein [Chloroflexi bacterium]|nr:site-2 protease family protein [Chloroflexota bacterium]